MPDCRQKLCTMGIARSASGPVCWKRRPLRVTCSVAMLTSWKLASSHMLNRQAPTHVNTLLLAQHNGRSCMHCINCFCVFHCLCIFGCHGVSTDQLKTSAMVVCFVDTILTMTLHCSLLCCYAATFVDDLCLIHYLPVLLQQDMSRGPKLQLHPKAGPTLVDRVL